MRVSSAQSRNLNAPSIDSSDLARHSSWFDLHTRVSKSFQHRSCALTARHDLAAVRTLLIYLGIAVFEFLLDSPSLLYSMYSAIWLHSCVPVIVTSLSLLLSCGSLILMTLPDN